MFKTSFSARYAAIYRKFTEEAARHGAKHTAGTGGTEKTGRENGNYAGPMIAKKREGPGKRVKGYISVSCYAMNAGAYDLTKRGEEEE